MADASDAFAGLQPVAAPVAATGPAAAPVAPGDPVSPQVSANDFSGLTPAQAPTDFSGLAPATAYDRIKALEPQITDPNTPAAQRPIIEDQYKQAVAQDVMQNDNITRLGRAVTDANWGDIGNSVLSTARQFGRGVAPIIKFALNPGGTTFGAIKDAAQTGDGSVSDIGTRVLSEAMAPVVGAAVGAVGDTTKGLLNAGSKIGETVEDFVAGNELADPAARQQAAELSAQSSLNRLKANAAYDQTVGDIGTMTGEPDTFSVGRVAGAVAALPEAPGADLVAQSSKVVGDLTEQAINKAAGVALSAPKVIAKAAPVLAPIAAGAGALVTGGAGPLVKVLGAEVASPIIKAAARAATPAGSPLAGLFGAVQQGRQAIKTYLFDAADEAGQAYRSTNQGESAIDSIIRQAPGVIQQAQDEHSIAGAAVLQATQDLKDAQNAVLVTGQSTVPAQKALAQAQATASAANMRVNMLQKGADIASYLKAKGVDGTMTRALADATSSAVHGAVLGGALATAESSPGDTNALPANAAGGAFYGTVLSLLGSAGAAAQHSGKSGTGPGPGGQPPLLPSGGPSAPQQAAPGSVPPVLAPASEGPLAPPSSLRQAAEAAIANAQPPEPPVVIQGQPHNPTVLAEALQAHTDAAVDAMVQHHNSIVSEAVGAPVPMGEQPSINPPPQGPLAPQESPVAPPQAPVSPALLPRPVLGPPSDVEVPVGYAAKQPAVGTEQLQWAPPVKDPARYLPANIATLPEAMKAVQAHVTPDFGSTNIRSYGYNPDASVLSVRFHNPYLGSDHYLYHEFPPEEFSAWQQNNQQKALEASAGVHHQRYIRLDYPYVRITNDLFNDGGITGRAAGKQAKIEGQARKLAGDTPPSGTGPLSTP